MTNRRLTHVPWVLGLVLLFFVLAGPAFPKKTPPPLHSVDLNAATENQLEQLPGIGPTTAKAIVAFRTKAGPFRRVEDLLVIRGISESKLERIRPYVFIAPPKKPAPQ
ncbi:MAG TPA: helix-hairpin-helix domain-containing protein [Candidatus Acidoferrales bacterium]|nr:helix-hairpin-helix domain-containing protein [Candidatus Acidoferrales bacterium]